MSLFRRHRPLGYSIDLLNKTTAAKQRSAKGHSLAAFYINAIDDNSVNLVKPGFGNDEDDDGDEQGIDKLLSLDRCGSKSCCILW